ncbi:MAG: 5-(carboxyamino)imidazole ribonucleotide synthase [Candidatus Curtissbacteria bacterium]
MTKTLGIIGGGQLGRMLSIAAKNLNFKTIVLDPTPQSPAGLVSDKQIIGDFKDPKQIHKLARIVDFLTFEIESANTKVLKDLVKEGITAQPPGETLEIIQDKLKQKQFLRLHNIPVPQFAPIKNKTDLRDQIKFLKYPVILKARFHAYDGRGNAVIKNETDIAKAFKKLGNRDLYLEKYIPLEKELAIQIARNNKGQIKSYPLVETIQKDNICHIVIAPAQISNKTKKDAIKVAKDVIKNLSGAGVFGVEMFLTKNSKVLINEIAPRVHNSGHYTIEACTTSQFEQHVRAVCNLPLASTTMRTKAAVMINILGKRNGPALPKNITKAANPDGVFVHIYGKKETRHQRKMGHITALGKTVAQALEKAKKAERQISI